MFEIDIFVRQRKKVSLFYFSNLLDEEGIAILSDRLVLKGSECLDDTLSTFDKGNILLIHLSQELLYSITIALGFWHFDGIFLFGND